MGYKIDLDTGKKIRIGYRKDDTVYHLATNLEAVFNNSDDAVRYFTYNTLAPFVPKSAAPREDTTIPRICVANRVEDCITAIGVLGVFRRCLEKDPDAKSYANQGREVYPVILLEFNREDCEEPPERAVPDIDITHELWITHPIKPKKIRMLWLSQYSIVIKRELKFRMHYSCKSVEFVNLEKRHNHPWINGKGHILNSSEEETVYMDEYAIRRT